MGTHWGVLLAPEFRPRFRLVGIVWVGKQPVGISSLLTSRTTSRFYPNFPRILRFYSSATIRRSRPGKSWCPDFNSIPSGFNIKDTCYTVPYSARTSFGLGVGMILMFMSRRQRYDWRLILLCLLHATRTSPWVGRFSHWIYCSFPFDHPGLAFQVGQDFTSGSGHVTLLAGRQPARCHMMS